MSSSAAEPVTRTHPSTAAQRISAGEEGASHPGAVWQPNLAGNSLRLVARQSEAGGVFTASLLFP